MDSRELERNAMVQEQLVSRGISNPRVLEALLKVPRHCFVPREAQDLAYDDRPLPIGLGQTISQPYMVACMTELLDLLPSDRVLEIGTGSGYQTAVLARLCAEVISVERHPELYERARACLTQLEVSNATLVCGDGSIGHAACAPYDAIIVTAGSPRVPRALLEQLADGGRLVCPVGGRFQQRLNKISKQGNMLITEEYTDCIFVPLLGHDGWPVFDE